MLQSSWVPQIDLQERAMVLQGKGPFVNAKASVATTPAFLGAGEGDRDSPEVASLFEKLARHGRLVDSNNTVEVQPGKKDYTSPIYSVTTFQQINLKAPLLKGVYGCGYNTPSKIQAVALPILLAEPPRNLIAQSQSGTGKTATFVLAFLSRVDITKDYPQVLCLSPTYELAIQTGEVVAAMSQYLAGIKIRYAIRGEILTRDEIVNEHILIGTPGKVLDWAYKQKLFDLAKISMFVLDEADIMVSTQGHQDQTYRIHSRLSPTCQVMFFSATYDDDVMEFANEVVPDATVIRLKREDETLDNIRQCYVYCANEMEKYQALVNIYGILTIGQAVIFCHTRKGARWLETKMLADGHAVALLSGELSIEDRLKVMDMYREGKFKALISTNVLSRGIDVEQTTLVINWDLPLELDKTANCETYLHRIGRTGRFGKQGVAVNLVDGEMSLSVLRQIEEHFGHIIQKLDIKDQEAIERLEA